MGRYSSVIAVVSAVGVVGVGACGKHGGVPAPHGAAAGGAPAPCPVDAELASRLRAHWQLEPSWKTELACTPGRFPADGWAISAVVDEPLPGGGPDDLADSWERSLVIAAGDGRVLAETEKHDIAPWYRAEGGGGQRYEVRDFDGDGVDELISTDGASHGGTTYQGLSIIRLDGAALATAFRLTTHFDNGGAVEDEADAYDCDAAVTYVPDGAATLIRAVGTDSRAAPPPADDEDCFEGTRTWRLVDGTFVRQ